MNEPYTLYALFNKATRQLSTFTFDISNFPHTILNTMLIKEFSFESLGLADENINMNRFKWVGDYDEGRLVDLVKEKKAIVTEKEIREKYNGLFFSKYRIEDVLYELILNSDMKTENGQKMKEYVSKLMTKKESDIQYFSNSDLHIWETDDATLKRQKDAFRTTSI